MTRTPNEAFEAVMRPIGSARGLPNEYYTSQDRFDQEKKTILFNQWIGAGFSCDVPDPGDVRPVDLLGIPLLLVRTEEGELCVYQNTCRHRGMILVEEARQVRRVMKCPYHGWCYDLQGRLLNTPHVGGAGCHTHDDINTDSLGLVRIPSSVWMGVVFVNLSGNAPPFEQFVAVLRSRWSEFADLDLHGTSDSMFELNVSTNWKLAVENYCESYHLPSVHPDLNTYSRLEDHYNIMVAGSCSGQGSSVYRQLTSEDGLRFDDLGVLSEHWDTGAEYIALYPNVLLGVHRDHTFALVLEPLGPALTRERVALFYTKRCVTDEHFKPLRERNRSLWKTVFEEDISVVEGMQQGRQGLYFDGGVFSPQMDGPTHNFHQWVATQWPDESSG